MVYGGENRLNKKEKKSAWAHIVCRRASLVTCHVFSFGGVVIMCCVVHSGLEGQINKESRSLFAAVHNDRGDPSLLSLTGWGSVGVEAVGLGPALAG